jgi:hypothetical protein
MIIVLSGHASLQILEKPNPVNVNSPRQNPLTFPSAQVHSTGATTYLAPDIMVSINMTPAIHNEIVYEGKSVLLVRFVFLASRSLEVAVFWH